MASPPTSSASGSFFPYTQIHGLIVDEKDVGTMHVAEVSERWFALQKTGSLIYVSCMKCIVLCRCWRQSSRERHVQELREVRDGCMGLVSQEEQLSDVSLRKIGQAMDINLQEPDGNRKTRDRLVEGLVAALIAEVPLLGKSGAPLVDASLRGLRQVRDGLSGQASQRDELETSAVKLSV